MKQKRKTRISDNDIEKLREEVLSDMLTEHVDHIYSKVKNELMNKTHKNTVRMTESELIDFIDGLVNEQIAVKGLDVYKKTHRESGNINKDYKTDVAKKMNDYMKDGSKKKYDPDPEDFPKGNGELEKMEKKAFETNTDQDEFIEDFGQSAGMENLDFEEGFAPDEDRMKAHIEGDAKTGNSPEYANAVETDVNKKVNAKRKRNALAKDKAETSYNRVAQPVVDQKNEDVENNKPIIKEEKVIKDIDKIFHLMDYAKKTN